MIKYLFEFICCSAVLYALYKLLIEGRVTHLSARLYIVSASLLSLLIPMLELPIYPAETLYYTLPIVWSEGVATDINGYMETKSTIDWYLVFSCIVATIYGVIVMLNFVRFGVRLYHVSKLRKRAKLSFYEAYTLAVSHEIKEPFSFWRTIYVNDKFASSALEMVVAHEYSHIQHHHTVERLFMEVLRCVCWFNPFIWLLANAIIEVQEWEADKDVIDKGYDVVEYRLLVFQQLYGYYPEVTCGLKSQTSKKRFLMMTDFKRRKFSPLRLCATIPVVAGMILAFGAVQAETRTVEVQKVEVASQPESTETAALLQKFSDYYKRNIRYPADAEAKGIDGRVVVQCSVNLVDGSAEVLRVFKSPASQLTAEVERVIKARKWETIQSVAERPNPKVILTFDFMIYGKTDESKYKEAVNGTVVMTYPK